MALPPTIYRVVIDLANIDRDCYARLQATVARHPSETAERLVLRLLAYALCYEEELTFTRGVSAGDEPDLWLKGPDGRVQLWIEVGLPEPERLLKASRHAERVVLLAAGSNRWRWDNAHLEKLSRAKNLTIYALDFNLVQQAAAELQRGIDWSLTISGGTLYLTRNGQTLESELIILAGQ